MINVIILLLMIITQVLGDVFLSNAMKIYGEISAFSPAVIIDVIGYLASSGWFYLSLFNLTLSWFLYLFCVSKMDLSYVLPINASGYIFNGLLSWLILHEFVSATRWYGTILISIGIFIVGYSKYLREKKEQEKQQKQELSRSNTSNTFNNLLPIVITIPTMSVLPIVWLGVIAMVVVDSVGDVLNAKGMKEIETLGSLSIGNLGKWLKGIFTNYNIIIGITCQAMALFLLISLLSWDDLSFVRPASAVSYIITIACAKYILHEKISKGRLIGIALILAGVLILSVG